MSTITEFLLARIGEKERAATTIASCSEVHPLAAMDLPPGVSVTCAVAHYRVDQRVKAECDALRQVVDLHRATMECAYRNPVCESCLTNREGYSDDWGPDHHPCSTVRALATLFADHPDFQDEWRIA